MTTVSRQTLIQLRGEIEFRAKLARQHVTGEMLVPDYYGKDEHDRILLERIEATRRDMALLREMGIGLSPFLELGAERGQRSLVLVNELGGVGVATDISFHQLKAMEHFATLFGLPDLPLRICCDANTLPFTSGAFSFIFCYQFLHHFPTLLPVVAEIRRVMSAGHFWFGEEPFRRVLKLSLYQQRAGRYADATRRRNRHLRLLESFISTERTDEVDHGIVENDEIALDDWLDVLRAFDRGAARLESAYGVRSRLAGRTRPRNRLNWLLGGMLAGLCRVDGGGEAMGGLGTATAGHAPVRPDALELTRVLACPACIVPEPAETFDRPRLVAGENGFRCPSCGATYPIHEGVIFLIPPEALRQLYPEVAAQ
jgi:SAM-dependent methyltransferase